MLLNRRDYSIINNIGALDTILLDHTTTAKQYKPATELSFFIFSLPSSSSLSSIPLTT